jgi:hypothetical protein
MQLVVMVTTHRFEPFATADQLKAHLSVNSLWRVEVPLEVAMPPQVFDRDVILLCHGALDT